MKPSVLWGLAAGVVVYLAARRYVQAQASAGTSSRNGNAPLVAAGSVYESELPAASHNWGSSWVS